MECFRLLTLVTVATLMVASLSLPKTAPISRDASNASLFCGTKNMLCSGVMVTYQCNVTSYILVWKSIPGILQITFSYYDDIGKKTQGDFTAELVNKSKGYLSSNLTFVASAKYNYTSIYCYDGVSGLPSASQCYARLFSLPHQVQNLTSHVTAGSLMLSWRPPINSSVNVTYYSIIVSPPPGSGNCASGECNTADTNLFITKIKDCENYNVSVQSVNCVGGGNANYVHIRHGTPGAVQALNYSYITDNTVAFTWEPPLNTGGKRIEFYIVFIITAPKQSGHCIDEECIVTNTDIIVSGLKPCYEYTFTVQAFNCRGIGPALSTQVKTEDAHFNFRVGSQKNITSCTDTLEIDYTWTGCSVLNITFHVVYFDSDASTSKTDLLTEAFEPNSSGMYLLPLRFNMKNNTQYFYSIVAFNKSDILTDFQTGVLSSKTECTQEDGSINDMWKLIFVITISIVVAVCLLFFVLSLACSVYIVRYRHMDRLQSS